MNAILAIVLIGGAGATGIWLTDVLVRRAEKREARNDALNERWHARRREEYKLAIQLFDTNRKEQP